VVKGGLEHWLDKALSYRVAGEKER
jgi:hypothetical protein